MILPPWIRPPRRGDVVVQLQTERRGFATFGSQPFTPPSPWEGIGIAVRGRQVAIQATPTVGLAGFKVGQAMSQATQQAAGSLLSLAGVPGGFDLFNLGYALTAGRKARPATQTVSGSINGQPFTFTRLTRSVY